MGDGSQHQFRSSMLEEPPAVFLNKEYICVWWSSFRESCYSSSVVLFNMSARLQSRVPGRRNCILTTQICDAADSISELSFRTESDRKGSWLSRATLPGCGQQHEERRFKFLERVWCVMTKLYRRESLCGPLTNRFAETNSTGAACGQIRSRVSRWPKLSERHSESQLSGHRSLAHAVPALSLPMESRAFCFFVACGARARFCFGFSKVVAPRRDGSWWSELEFGSWVQSRFRFRGRGIGTRDTSFSGWRWSDCVVAIATTCIFLCFSVGILQSESETPAGQHLLSPSPITLMRNVPKTWQCTSSQFLAASATLLSSAIIRRQTWTTGPSSSPPSCRRKQDEGELICSIFMIQTVIRGVRSWSGMFWQRG